ncbi:MAG: protein kinase [Gammaproteobacteria bacterium]|nr:protein kinase [Gammaproteobacteria bacterium]
MSSCKILPPTRVFYTVFSYCRWEIFADAETPWPGKNNREAYNAMRSGEKMDMPPNPPPLEIRHLMYDCWNLNPRLRPKIAGVKAQLETVGAKYNVYLKDAATKVSKISIISC